MRSYIMFFRKFNGFIPNVKYKIKKEDGKYYYIASDKIAKVDLNNNDFIIGAINEGRFNG